MPFPFLKKENINLREQYKFIGKECKIYIPKYFFESNLADIVGENCETMGLFWFSVENEMYELQLPVKIMFSFSEQTTKKGFKIQPKMVALDYDVFILKTGDIFLYNTAIETGYNNIHFFISKIIEGGKMPPTVSYNSSAEILFKALTATDTNASLGVPAVSFEFLLSELYRSKRNMSDEFRFAYNKNNEFDFKMIRITKVPELISVFTSITGEDTNNQLMNSIIRVREKKKDRESPLENVLNKR